MNRLALYHQNDALLYQFLLFECLRIHQKLQSEHHQALSEQLLGPSDLSWNSNPGPLQKLQQYYVLFSTQFPDRLSKNIAKSLGNIQKALEKGSFEKLNKKVKDLTSQFFEHLQDFKESEHVLFFLLQYHEEFDAMYGKSFTAKKLSSLFPKGIQEAGTFIEKRYAKKGYHHLLPIIQQKVAKLMQDD